MKKCFERWLRRVAVSRRFLEGRNISRALIGAAFFDALIKKPETPLTRHYDDLVSL